MRILITGISGFVARHFVELLSASGNAYTIAGVYHNNLPQFSPDSYPNVDCQFHRINLMDSTKLGELLRAFKPDQILHLAANSSVASSWHEPAKTIQENMGMFLHLIEQVRINAIPARILSVGSAEEYGHVLETDLPLTERNPTNPVSPYGTSRVMQQKLVEIYSKNYGLDILHTRSFNHIGPYQTDKFVISSFVRQVALQLQQNAGPIRLTVGDVEVTRDFSDVRDVVKAYHGLLMNGTKGETYNVCSGQGYVLKDIIGTLSQITGTEVTYHSDAKNFRPAENKKVIGSYAKINHEIGWKPVIGMEQSLTDLLHYWETMLSLQAI
ncbi:MAG: NAD-dependent epimerase/dehydratase [Ferruginibacter sp.]|nr:NAD-dependent epimerase/dehydratase [Ferruginibacter sp.]